MGKYRQLSLKYPLHHPRHTAGSGANEDDLWIWNDAGDILYGHESDAKYIADKMKDLESLHPYFIYNPIIYLTEARVGTDIWYPSLKWACNRDGTSYYVAIRPDKFNIRSNPAGFVPTLNAYHSEQKGYWINNLDNSSLLSNMDIYDAGSNRLIYEGLKYVFTSIENKNDFKCAVVAWVVRGLPITDGKLDLAKHRNTLDQIIYEWGGDAYNTSNLTNYLHGVWGGLIK